MTAEILRAALTDEIISVTEHQDLVARAAADRSDGCRDTGRRDQACPPGVASAKSLDSHVRFHAAVPAWAVKKARFDIGRLSRRPPMTTHPQSL
mgnify:CR=1 FL=1